MLNMAARNAMRSVGLVEPNPLVGAVIVKDNRVLGIGHHRCFGSLHAERDALLSCQRQRNDPKGATIYVTLEPCCHHGKQPPCTDAMIQAGISRVVIAARDPHPTSAGGIEVLRRAGIKVESTDQSPAAAQLSRPFVQRVATGLPWVIAKWAQTIDGRIATRTGESKWISNERSRRQVHRLRAQVDTILTAMGTILADDPLLTARGVPIRRIARRVVLDTTLDIPLECQLVRTAHIAPVCVLCAQEIAIASSTRNKREQLKAAGVSVLGVPEKSCSGGALNGGLDLESALRTLVDTFETTTVMIEAGAGLLGSLMHADLVDEIRVYQAPMMLSDELARAAAVGRVTETLHAALSFDLIHTRRLNDDVELIYRRNRDAWL